MAGAKKGGPKKAKAPSLGKKVGVVNVAAPSAVGSAHDGYFKKLTDIWVRPLTALEHYKSEVGIAGSFLFMFISGIISGVISVIFQVIGGATSGDAFVSFLFLLGANIVFTFVFSGVFHGVVKLLGGSNPYYQTFKAFAYMSAFGVIISLIGGLAMYTPLIALLDIPLLIWVLVLLGSAIKHYTDMSTGKLVAVWVIAIIAFIVLYVVALLFTAGMSLKIPGM